MLIATDLLPDLNAGAPVVLCLDPVAVLAHLIVDDVLDDQLFLKNHFLHDLKLMPLHQIITNVMRLDE